VAAHLRLRPRWIHIAYSTARLLHCYLDCYVDLCLILDGRELIEIRYKYKVDGKKKDHKKFMLKMEYMRSWDCSRRMKGRKKLEKKLVTQEPSVHWRLSVVMTLLVPTTCRMVPFYYVIGGIP
jgi:hypothetical protein